MLEIVKADKLAPLEVLSTPRDGLRFVNRHIVRGDQSAAGFG